jgi:hypothetical protein
MEKEKEGAEKEKEGKGIVIGVFIVIKGKIIEEIMEEVMIMIMIGNEEEEDGKEKEEMEKGIEEGPVSREVLPFHLAQQHVHND